jgi:hypothetical protein
MSCDPIRELLPWFLNGTLSAPERQAVEEHLAACEACRGELAATRLAWRIFDQHVPPEALVRLAWEDASDGGAADLAPARSHVALCPRCAADLELARMSRRLEEDEGLAVLSPRAPRAFEPGAGAGAGGAGSLPPVAASGSSSPAALPAPRPSRLRAWRGSAVAAGLAAVVAASGWLHSDEIARNYAARLAAAHRADRAAGVPSQAPSPLPPTGFSRQPSTGPGGQAVAPADLARLAAETRDLARQVAESRQSNAALRQRIDGLLEPHANVPVVEIDSSAVVRRGAAGADAAGRQRVRASQPTHIELVSESCKSQSRHTVRIVPASGGAAWENDELICANRTYWLFLPADFLPPGTYTIEVLPAGGEGEPEAFPLEVAR